MKKTTPAKPLLLDRATIARLDASTLPVVAGGIKAKTSMCSDSGTWRC